MFYAILTLLALLTHARGQMEPGLVKLYHSLGGRRLLADSTICPTGWTYNPDDIFVDPISGENSPCSDAEVYFEENDHDDPTQLQHFFSTTPCCSEPSVEGDCGTGYVLMGDAEFSSEGGECESQEDCRASCDGEGSCDAYACEENVCRMNVELTYTDECGQLCQSQTICVKNSTQTNALAETGNRRRLTLQTPRCHSGYVDVTNGQAAWWACGRNCPGGRYWTDTSCNCACRHQSLQMAAPTNVVILGGRTSHRLSAGSWWPPRPRTPPLVIMCSGGPSPLDDIPAFISTTFYQDLRSILGWDMSTENCHSESFFMLFAEYTWDKPDTELGSRCCTWYMDWSSKISMKCNAC